MKSVLMYAVGLSLFLSLTGCSQTADTVGDIPASSVGTSFAETTESLTSTGSTTTATTPAETTVTTMTTATKAPAPSKPVKPQTRPTAARPSKPQPTRPAKPTAGQEGSEIAPGNIPAKVQTSAGLVTVVFHETEAKKLLGLVNEARRKAGVKELVWTNDYAAATKLRAAEITIQFSHTRPDGSAWNTVHEDISGENLAKGFGSAEAVFKGWMQSPGHRQNILYPTFTTMNVAFIESHGVQCWAQNFGY